MASSCHFPFDIFLKVFARTACFLVFALACEPGLVTLAAYSRTPIPAALAFAVNAPFLRLAALIHSRTTAMVNDAHRRGRIACAGSSRRASWEEAEAVLPPSPPLPAG